MQFNTVVNDGNQYLKDINENRSVIANTQTLNDIIEH